MSETELDYPDLGTAGLKNICRDKTDMSYPKLEKAL
jgi:hypothetical protein